MAPAGGGKVEYPLFRRVIPRSCSGRDARAGMAIHPESGANAESLENILPHVITSEAKQSPMLRIEIASSLRFSQ